MQNRLSYLEKDFEKLVLSGVADGYEAAAIADLARRLEQPVKTPGKTSFDGPRLVVIARDHQRQMGIEQALSFFAPEFEVISLPAWDCQPYDRVSPNQVVSARRMSALASLAHMDRLQRPVIWCLTASAVAQRLPSRDFLRERALVLPAGAMLPMNKITEWLESNGFLRASTVRDNGEYAVRGGILDLFEPGAEAPVRLDFFGDTLESVRRFDPETQRTTGQAGRVDLIPMSEVVLDAVTIKRFRQGYLAAFGAPGRDDTLYEAISEGRRHAGLEHWLPLFHERLETVFDYAGGAPLVLDHLAREAVDERLALTTEHYKARVDSAAMTGATMTGSAMVGASITASAVPYQALAPHHLYLTEDEWTSELAGNRSVDLLPFAAPDRPAIRTLDLEVKAGHNFAAERAADSANIFDALIAHVKKLQVQKKQVLIACWTEGSLDRLRQVLLDHSLAGTTTISAFAELKQLTKDQVALCVLELEHGFETPQLAVLCEQDILGDRLVRAGRKKKKSADTITEATSLQAGDYVVHVEHGIARFVGLKTVEAAGAPHDCLELEYHGGDRLFLPVENIELLARYGAAGTEATLDRLGGAGWQNRKAKLKKRIREIAEGLIKTAAARELKSAPSIAPPEGLYDEFCARFPFDETEDQLASIEAVFDDLISGRPMDRLVCGDVGFGKTEVALRAAFVVAMTGRQVAVVVPTTLLARQHFKTFSERFSGLPLRLAQASRLVGSKELTQTKKGLADGSVDVAVGTHALLNQAIKFRDLGLLIIDEEQHFGVKHKERLKELKSDVHVLTLTATPIPRTLQMALSGVRELSIIATPPIDRMSVRTFITPFDALMIREALLRERYRGGQSFYVCPRIADLSEIEAFLSEQVPELKVAVAHGQMPPTQLDDIMTAFYDGKYDVLLSTTIVESGLDVPRANTLVIHRSQMFGLAQLYQLRGRVGRSKARAYALFTVPAKMKLTDTAERRLKVLQSLDTLGAGFQLASHDLDIRGGGNLLGDEQSGHIREVGFELYQQMLEEAVASMRAGGEELDDERWSPSITVGTPVLIPEPYVPDLQLRMGLYRQLADLKEAREIDAFGAELIDRFGPLPDEVELLLKLVFVKALCLKANVEKVDAGPKGVVIGFRHNLFPNPQGLVGYIAEQASLAKIRPDHKLVLQRNWPKPEDRLKGTASILTKLVRLVEGQQKAA